MARTIRGREFVGEWIMLRRGDRFTGCVFKDCIVQNVDDGGDRYVTRSTFVGCTLIGPGWRDDDREMMPAAQRGFEPEVLSAMMPFQTRPAPRQRRSIFNWRKRD